MEQHRRFFRCGVNKRNPYDLSSKGTVSDDAGERSRTLNVMLPFLLARRLYVWCAFFCILALLGVAGAQGCPQRDVQIEQEGLGVVQADVLDFSGDVALLTRACFRLGQFDLDAARARADDAGVVADDVQIAGESVAGVARQATVRGDTTTLAGLNLQLTLPAASLPGLPLPAGAYDLRSAGAELARGRLRFAEATLRRRDGGETYRLKGAVLEGQHLSAEGVDLVRLSAGRLDAVPGNIRAGPVEVGLCRDPAARELTLRAASLSAGPEGTVLRGAQLELFGLPLLTPPTLSLPLPAGGATLAESAQSLAAGAQLLSARLSVAAPQALLSDGRYGLRDLPLLDANDTRLNAVLHPNYLEFGVRTRLDGADLALGIFEDPDPADPDVPVPQLAVSRFPLSGPQFGVALRGGGQLSEARLGAARAWGWSAAGGLDLSARAEGDLGAAYQLGRADPFAHAQLAAGASWLRTLGPGALTLRAAITADGYVFPDAGQTALEFSGGAAYVGAFFGVSLDQLERQVWGLAPLPALQAAPARVTTLGAFLTPNWALGPLTVGRLGYLYRYDWLAGATTSNALSATVAATFGPLTVVPTASYDWAAGRLDVSTEATLTSRCFRYGAAVDVYRQPDRSGLGVRLIFNLR